MRDRENAATVTQAVLQQAAVASTRGKKGVKHFNDLIRKLSDG